MRRLSDGERDILLEQARDAYDDESAADDVELVTEPCPGCGAEYTHPADECDPCCSAACADKAHAGRVAGVNAALASWWAGERARMRDASCVRCRGQLHDLPESLTWCPLGGCEAERVAALYADDQPADDEFPW